MHADNDKALRLASKNGHLEVVQFQSGADIHADDDYAPGWASGNGHPAAAKFLDSEGQKHS